MYNWVTLLYSRDWHNIVHQLYFNKKKNNLKKSRTRWLHWWILPNIQRINASPFHTLPKSRRRNTSKLILQGQHYPDTKTRQGCHKERKLYANIPDEHRCKNPQQNISKPNSTIHYKDHTYDKWDLFQGRKGGLTSAKPSVWYTTLTKWGIKIMIISIDAEKAFDEIQYLFMVKKIGRASCRERV